MRLLPVLTIVTCFVLGCKNSSTAPKENAVVEDTKHVITIDDFYIDENEINGGAEYKEFIPDTTDNK